MYCRLEDEEGLVLTPFEKNLEVWRQLWRVLERSDIVVQASQPAVPNMTLPVGQQLHDCKLDSFTSSTD